MAATAAAHAPVPDAKVGPTPRSQIRMRTWSGRSTTANSTFVPAGNRVVLERGPEAAVRSSSEWARAQRTAGCRRAAPRRVDRLPVDVDDPPAGVVGWPMAARQTKRGGRGSRTLSVLSPASVEMMTDAAGRPAVSAPAAQRREAAHAVAGHLRVAAVGVVSRTDGVPLFIEELTKAVVESGLLKDAGGRFELTGPLPPRAIPTTLYDSLMARLDRFAPVKEVAQIGAVFGREFSYQLLAAVVDIPAAQLDLALSQLVASELVFQRGTPPDAMYSFKHALVQDTAYQSLLRSKRHQLHAKIARMMEERFPEIAEARPELLAHHFTEAGLASQAIVYRQRAGERDLERSAYAEAISHLKQGLEVLEALPDRPERVRQELSLRLALGSALTATQGYAGPEVGETYLRARELCRELGEAPPQLFPALHGLYRFYHVRGELQAAREPGEQLLKLAVSVQDLGLFVEANRALGVPLFWLGDVTAALENLERGARLYQAQKQRSHASVFGTDPGVVCLSYGALALWHLGYPEQAYNRSREALALARNLSHHHSLALALVWAAWLDQFRREPQAARGHAEAAIAICSEQGFPLFMSMGAILRGWALVQEGCLEEGSVQMRQGLADLRATGAGLWQPTFLSLIAEADGRIGQAERGTRGA